MKPRKLGILAGGGALPARLIDRCRAEGRPAFVLAIDGQTDPETVRDVPHAWARLGAAEAILGALKEAGAEDLVLAGALRRPSLAALRPDARMARFLARAGIAALGDDGVLKAVVGELEREGFRVVGVDSVLPGLLAPKGPLGRHAPDAGALADIARGLAVARGIGALDVGQGAVVQQGIVLAVEAAEGTDAMIERTGTLKREGPGGVLVKAIKPGQERRADLPAIGPTTVARASAAGLAGIAVEAGHVLVIERERTIADADAAGLFVYGIPPEPVRP